MTSPDTDHPSYSSLAALSARHSLKRARVLYATNPQAAFLPAVDPVIHQASLDRRRRRPKQARTAAAVSNTSTALAVVNEEQPGHTTLTMQPVAGEEPAATSSALTLPSESNKSDRPKPGGILVVS